MIAHSPCFDKSFPQKLCVGCGILGRGAAPSWWNAPAFCSEPVSPPWWKGGGGFAAGGMLPTAHGWRGVKRRLGSGHSYSFPQCARQHWFSIGLSEKRTYSSNSEFINFSLCRSGRGRPPLFFSRKEKGERNDKGLRPLTPSRSTYTSAFPSAQSPRETYFVALLRRQEKAAWCSPRKSCFRSDRYVSLMRGKSS